MPSAAELQQMAARFAPTPSPRPGTPVARRPGRACELIAASKMVDGLFLRQVWSGNDAMLLDLVATPAPRAGTPALLPDQQGPWDRLDHTSRSSRERRRNRGRQLLSEGATRQDIERWIQSLPEGERATATGFFSAIRRSRAAASRRFRTASSTRTNSRARPPCCAKRRHSRMSLTLKAFPVEARGRVSLQRLLRERRRLDGAARGHRADHRPLEVYEDEFFNYKAAFESFITVRDEAESAKIQRLSGELQEIENRCRSTRHCGNPAIGVLAPWPSSTSSSPLATATAACRRPPSTSRTTNGSCLRRAPSA